MNISNIIDLRGSNAIKIINNIKNLCIADPINDIDGIIPVITKVKPGEQEDFDLDIVKDNLQS